MRTPEEALQIINQAVRAIQANADTHDVLNDCLNTLASVVMEMRRDGTKPLASDPEETAEETADSGA